MASVTFRHGARHVTFVDIDFDGQQDNAKFMLTSDEHLDNVHCDQSLFRDHLEQAGREDALILNNGDMMCAMQGKFDRRSDRSQLRPELQKNEYLDSLVRYVADFLEPHAKRFISISRGNHETSIIKYNQTDLTERLVGVLNHRTGSNILAGGYGGWVFFRCRRGKQRQTIKLCRHHGFGGSSPMTRGVMSVNRMAAYLPDPDIVWTGHTHSDWVVPHARKRINSQGTLYKDTQLHLKTPGYKSNPLDDYEGWETEKGFAPLTNGAAMLNIFFDGRKSVQRFKAEIQRMT